MVSPGGTVDHTGFKGLSNLGFGARKRMLRVFKDQVASQRKGTESCTHKPNLVEYVCSYDYFDFCFSHNFIKTKQQVLTF